MSAQSMSSPASFIDHTLLSPDASADRVRLLCEEAVECGFASVCIPPVYVPLAADLLYGSGVATGTVVGFPLGYVPATVKAFEAGTAVAAGATEVDMVIHVGAALEGRFDSVEEEIRQVVASTRGAAVKVIIECCLLEDSIKEALVECVVAGGAAYVKTSTGFAASGATVADVRLLAKAADGRVKVKAAGGIRDWATCRAMLEAGSDRIGTSVGVAIVKEWQRAEGA